MKHNDLDLIEIFVRIPSTRLRVYKGTYMLFLPKEEPASYKQELETDLAAIFLDKRMDTVKKLFEEDKLKHIDAKKYFLVVSNEDKEVFDKFKQATDYALCYYATDLTGLNLEDDFFKERLVFYKLNSTAR